MNDDAAHLDPEEVRRLLWRLRVPDILRLASLARAWARGLRQHDADDLLGEAFDRLTIISTTDRESPATVESTLVRDTVIADAEVPAA
jgi:hypothetical protein